MAGSVADIVRAELARMGITPQSTRPYIRRPYAYPLNFLTADANALAINGGTQNLVATGDVGLVSVFTHISFKSDGPFLFQIRPSDLNAGLWQNPISSETVLSMLDRPGMLPAPIIIKGSNSLRLEMTNDYGALVNQVRFTLWGYRDFAAPENC